jgi:hypothetical protein
LLNVSILVYASHIVVIVVVVIVVLLILILLGLHYQRRISASLPSCSPRAIPILRYLSPIKNPHLSYVILCIIFDSTEYIRADPSE